LLEQKAFMENRIATLEMELGTTGKTLELEKKMKEKLKQERGALLSDVEKAKRIAGIMKKVVKKGNN
jgi:hypothetical protein